MINVACILTGGLDYKIGVGGRIIPFEMHPYCGPCALTKTGRELKLGPRHPFWNAVTLWNEQGRRVSDQGLCLWQEPPDFLSFYKRTGKKTYLTKEGKS